MEGLKGKTLFITGASRGIGKAIALRAATEGANIVVAAKTSEPHPKLEGTIFSAAREIEEAGGRALPCVMDVRSDEQVEAAVLAGVETFGGIDILVNNASSIHLAGTLDTPMKRFDLLHAVNVRGTFLASKLCLPHLARSSNPHILNLAPPPNLDPKWFRNHLAYTISKYGMSLCVLGMADEFRSVGVAVNALWPRTTIATAAIEHLVGPAGIRQCRSPAIVADAAALILGQPSRKCTGNFFIDDEVLRDHGVTDLSPYIVDPAQPLLPDFFL